MRISESEAVVMEVLWATQPLSADEVAGALSGQCDWQGTTVKTLLNRLLKKGAIGAETEGRRYLYRPVLTRDDWAMGESESLLDRVFGGRIAPLVAHFSEHRRLSKRDIADLKRLIRTLDDER